MYTACAKHEQPTYARTVSGPASVIVEDTIRKCNATRRFLLVCALVYVVVVAACAVFYARSYTTIDRAVFAFSKIQVLLFKHTLFSQMIMSAIARSTSKVHRTRKTAHFPEVWRILLQDDGL